MNVDAPRQLAKTFSFYYDQEWLGWAPQVMELTLREKFGLDPDEKQLERVEATREVLRADRFAFNPLLFENVTRAFCGLEMTPEMWQPVDAAQMAYGLYSMRKLVGPGPLRQDAVGEEVEAYMATTLAREPLCVPTEWFGFHPAEENLRRLMHMPEVQDKAESHWEALMAEGPETPRALFRAVKTRLGPEDEAEGQKEIVYRHVVRLASIWADLYRRDAAPEENPFGEDG
ncbi:hypothetical protein [Salinibacter ruber]|uniref:Uncharacterized protein n=1 Tax=Salinibacter ruber TaxID=146919 RepID=A0AAW5P6W3_9BACT|nr:hypothetical protein [Salinibacter ruber]MCS4157640.1 hypothetical protein [Salinibacter ruber]